MIERHGYRCPNCGAPGAGVRRTASFQKCVLRERKCSSCGHVHETVEIHIDASSAWREAALLLLENAARAGKAAAAPAE